MSVLVLAFENGDEVEEDTVIVLLCNRKLPSTYLWILAAAAFWSSYSSA